MSERQDPNRPSQTSAWIASTRWRSPRQNARRRGRPRIHQLENSMQRRAFVGGAAMAAAVAGLGLAPALAQDPIVFGLITPLSPPGETALGQLAKRGAEIGVEYL